MRKVNVEFNRAVVLGAVRAPWKDRYALAGRLARSPLRSGKLRRIWFGPPPHGASLVEALAAMAVETKNRRRS